MENKPTRRLSWIAVLGLVFVLCLLAYFLANQFVNMSTNRLKDAIAIAARSDQNIKALGDGLIFYDGGTLHALDGRGRQIWSYGAGSYANFSVSDAGVATWSGTMLSLLPADSGIALFSGQVESDVLEARMSRSYAAVQVMPKPDLTGQNQGELTEHNSTMLILDLGGRQVDRIELKRQTVLDFGFFSNGRLFWVMSLDTEGTVPICTITTYRPGQVLTGELSDTSQVIYRVLFQQQKVRTVGDTYIKDFDYQNREIAANQILVYGWYLIDVDDTDPNNPLMLFVPTNQSDGGVGVNDIRIIRGQEDQRVRLPGTATQVFASGNAVYAFTVNSDRVTVWQVGASEPTTYQLPLFIDGVLALTKNHSAIVTAGSGVYMIPLP